MLDTLGKRLAQARREMGVRERRDVSKVELAKAAGVDSSMLSQYEADTKAPREDTLARLADFLGVTPAWLRYGVGDTKTPTPVEVGGHMFTPNPALDYRVTDEEHAADEREYQAKQRAKKPPKRA